MSVSSASAAADGLVSSSSSHASTRPRWPSGMTPMMCTSDGHTRNEAMQAVQAVTYRLRTTRAAAGGRVPTTPSAVRPCRVVCSYAPPTPPATLSRCAVAAGVRRRPGGRVRLPGGAAEWGQGVGHPPRATKTLPAHRGPSYRVAWLAPLDWDLPSFKNAPRRRRAGQLLLSVATPVGVVGELGAAGAAAAAVPAVVQPADAAQARAQLLSVIRGGGDEAAVQAAIEWLAPYNPTAEPARSPQLEGEWRLLWSSATAEVTKVRCRVLLCFVLFGVLGARSVWGGGGCTPRRRRKHSPCCSHGTLGSWALLSARGEPIPTLPVESPPRCVMPKAYGRVEAAR